MNDIINLEKNEQQLKRNIEYLKSKNILIPTFEQMKNPDSIPKDIKEELKNVDINEINPINLFRICWKNQPVHRGLYQKLPNYIELPSELTGVKAKIIALSGKYFPTGSHKVGASFACLIPQVITGQFNLQKDYAVWPSTGNFCRGGVYNSVLLGCKSIAILPENMSIERFNWLKNISCEIISTHGSESNVKEIYDKIWELKRTRDNIIVFNQFKEFCNHLWHYDITGNAMNNIAKAEIEKGKRLAGICLSSGSSGILGSADFIKELYPKVKLVMC